MRDMRRVWLGMALGWGALLLWAGVAFGVVLLRAQGRAEARWTAALAEAQEQEEALRQLDARFALEAPSAGQPPAPDARRLRAYLAAREDALAAFSRLEGDAAEDADAADALERAGRHAELRARVQEALVRSLRKHGMSPREFGALTGALYASAHGADAARREKALEKKLAGLERAVDEVEEKLEDDALPAPLRKVLEAEVRALEALQQKLEAQQARREALARAPDLDALREGLGERVEKAANPAFDLFVLAEGAPPPPPLPGGALPPVPPKR